MIALESAGAVWQRIFLSLKEKKDIVEIEGIVLETLPNANFRVRADDGSEILAQISGRMRKFYINIIPGDRVKMELSKYDLTRGRVVYRYK